MVKTKTMWAQLIARAVIFLLFLLAIFIEIRFLKYVFILFIIANIVLGFINSKKNILTNIIFVILTPLLFVPVLEYLITIILEVILGIHLAKFYLWFRKGGVEEVKVKKVKGKKEEIKGRKFPVWLIVLLTVVAIVVLIVALLIILAFGSFTKGGVQVAG